MKLSRHASASDFGPMRGQLKGKLAIRPPQNGSGGRLLHKVMYIIIHNVSYKTGTTTAMT